MLQCSCQLWCLFMRVFLLCVTEMPAFISLSFSVCVGVLVVKRGCQSSCQTDSHSSLLCNSLISLLSSETHTHTHTLSTDALNMQIVLMTAYIFVRKCTPINMQSKCRAAAHRGNEEQTCCYHWVQLIATESWLFRGHSIEIGVFAALPRTCLIPHVTKSVLCLPHLDFFFFPKLARTQEREFLTCTPDTQATNLENVREKVLFNVNNLLSSQLQCYANVVVALVRSCTRHTRACEPNMG